MTHTAKLIRIYFCFIKKDILESAIYGRDWGFIYNHMKAFHSYIVYRRGPIGKKTNKDILLNKLESSLLNTYTHSDKSCLEECVLPKDSYCIELEHFNEDDNTTLSRSLFDSMDIFIKSYLKADIMINPNKNSHLQLHNTFNEYHNALSHITPLFYTDNSATYKKDSNSYEKNIKKAMSHLVRGTLDSCKSIIDFNMSKIIADENLLNSYRELRKKELHKIGFIDDSVHKNSHKNIVIEYMKYVNRLQK